MEDVLNVLLVAGAVVCYIVVLIKYIKWGQERGRW
jgi:hypothetical protein